MRGRRFLLLALVGLSAGPADLLLGQPRDILALPRLVQEIQLDGI